MLPTCESMLRTKRWKSHKLRYDTARLVSMIIILIDIARRQSANFISCFGHVEEKTKDIKDVRRANGSLSLCHREKEEVGDHKNWCWWWCGWRWPIDQGNVTSFRLFFPSDVISSMLTSWLSSPKLRPGHHYQLDAQMVPLFQVTSCCTPIAIIALQSMKSSEL